jgi:predicted amidohydrolase/tetratricopeptide (TPR) repeat protein
MNMGLANAEECFKIGRFRAALNKIDQEETIPPDAKLLKGLILFYNDKINETLKLALEFDEGSLAETPLVEFKVRIIKALPLFMLFQWEKSFNELKKAKGILENLGKNISEKDKIWIGEFQLLFGLQNEILFGKRKIAINLVEQAQNFFTEVEDYRGISHSLNILSLIYFFEGYLDDSLKSANQSLIISEDKGIESEKVFSYNRIGEYYFSVGKLDLALSTLQSGVSIAKEIDQKWLEGEIHLNLGRVYYRQGNFQLSENESKLSLEIAKDVGDEHLVAKNSLNFGDILQTKGGSIHGAIEKYHEAFRIFRNLKDPNCSIDTNLKLGKAYLALGENDLAYQQFQNSYTFRLWDWDDNQPKDTIPLNLYAYPETLYQLVLVTLELKQNEKTNHYLQKLQEFLSQEPNSLVEFQVELAKALILKQSKRIQSKSKAQNILKKLVTQNVIDHGLTVTAILNYCDMLVDELTLYGDAEVLEELENLFQMLFDMGQKTQSSVLMIEALLLRSKKKLLEGKEDLVDTLLDQARTTAENKGLSYLFPKIMAHRELVQSVVSRKSDRTYRAVNLKEQLDKVELQSFIIETLQSSFSQDLSSQLFPISRMMHRKKYQLIYQDLLEQHDSVQRSTFRIGIAQIGKSQSGDLLSEFYQELHSGLFELKGDKIEIVRSKVKEMIDLAQSKNINVVLFPELSIDLNHPQLLEDILSYAKKYNMYIIPGSFHNQSTNRNTSQIVSPSGVLWEQEKHIPATIAYQGKRFTEGIEIGEPPKKTIISQTEYGRIAVVICRDFLDMDLRVELKNFEPPVDLIFNLAFTPVTADFKAAHFDARRSIYAYCFFANVAEFGDSSIYTPEKERIERSLPAGEEGIIFKDVDLFQLRSERKKWEMKQKIDKPFIQSTR